MSYELLPIGAAGAFVDSVVAMGWADAMKTIDALEGLTDAERDELRRRAKSFVLAERERQRLATVEKLRRAGQRPPADYAKGDPAAIFNGTQ